MNKNIVSLLKNSSYVILSNLLSLLISILIVLILPKIIGVEGYGYWQLYIFYVSYVGFLHLGWVDGIYLRYGGKEYQELEKQKFFSQFVSLLVFQSIIAVGLFLFSYLFSAKEEDKLLIFMMLSFSLVATNTRYLFIYILQATNRIKESSYITLFDRGVYAFLLILFILLDLKYYQLMIVADLIGRVFSLFLSIYLCKELVFQKISEFKLEFSEIYKNIKIGSSLMLSNVCSMLIIGVARFGIEYRWDIVTFGKISLIFSVSAFLMVFVNAVGIVLFPILKRVKEGNIVPIFVKARDAFSVVILGMLFFYYPVKLILSSWLIEYSDKMIYMSIIFPVVFYEGKMALLLNTYFKVLRLERKMLFINFYIMLLSLFFTVLSIFKFNNLTLVVFSVVMLLALRSIIFEYVLSRLMNFSTIKEVFFETCVVFSFIFFNFALDLIYSILSYAIIFILYILFVKFNTAKNNKLEF